MCKGVKTFGYTFFKRYIYIYMSLSEQEKNNLVNDGKFTPEQVEFFSNNGLRYNTIKLFQGTMYELLETRNRILHQGSNLALENINSHVYNEIQDRVSSFQQSSQRRRNINDHVMELIRFYITDIMDLNMFAERTEDNDSVGGKRRGRKSKRQKSVRKQSRRRSNIRKSRKV